MRIRRVFLIVLDSFGIGELPDAVAFGDAGSNTLAAVSRSNALSVPHLTQLGLFNIEGVNCRQGVEEPAGAYARMEEKSAGKDTTLGHWEIAGIVTQKPLPTYPHGFPPEVLDVFEEKTGRGVLCNRPYSGTQVIRDYGREHVETGKLIVYTSADSVFQIAAHEDIVPVERLYEYSGIAREILTGRHGVGRVIARPFTGHDPNYVRTSRRHDFSIPPTGETMLDCLSRKGLATIGVGKINDIFAGVGISSAIRTTGNEDGMRQTLRLQSEDFEGLCFINLVDFDMLYGHRNDVDGYAAALTAFDNQLAVFLRNMRKEDVLLITADHGCDPSTPSTDHSREYTPLLICGEAIRSGVDLGTRNTFADIGATVLDLFGIPERLEGKSFKEDILR